MARAVRLGERQLQCVHLQLEAAHLLRTSGEQGARAVSEAPLRQQGGLGSTQPLRGDQHPRYGGVGAAQLHLQPRRQRGERGGARSESGITSHCHNDARGNFFGAKLHQRAKPGAVVQRQCSGRVLPSWLAGGRATNVRRGHTARPSPRALRPSLSDESGIWGASGAIRSNGGACASNSPPRQPRPLLVERGGVASGWQQPSQATARFSIYLSIYLSHHRRHQRWHHGPHHGRQCGHPWPCLLRACPSRRPWGRAGGGASRVIIIEQLQSRTRHSLFASSSANKKFRTYFAPPQIGEPSAPARDSLGGMVDVRPVTG